jgi:hypothetical protein
VCGQPCLEEGSAGPMSFRTFAVDMRSLKAMTSIIVVGGEPFVGALS